MSRSRRRPFATISKAWSKFKERAFRHRIKKACHDAEIDFNPDEDFEELTQSHKKLKDYGTKLGFDISPDSNEDTWIQEQHTRLKRK